MGNELAVVQTVSTAVNALANTANLVITNVRRVGIVRAEEVAKIRAELTAVRHELNAVLIARLTRLNINEIFDLYDLAETRQHSPNQYARALAAAEQATRLLADNLADMARKLR